MHVLILNMSLFCVAMYELQNSGMIFNPISKSFHWLRDRIDRTKSKSLRFIYQIISKPITSCVICFASTYGTIAFIYFGGDWYYYPYCVIVCSLFNYIIYCAVRVLEKI